MSGTHPATTSSTTSSTAAREAPPETFNPWSVVNLVFHHLADEGLHPVLGATGDPGAPAAQLLRALGIAPTVEGNRQVTDGVRDQLAQLRTAFSPLPQDETAQDVQPRCHGAGTRSPSTGRPDDIEGSTP